MNKNLGLLYLIISCYCCIVAHGWLETSKCTPSVNPNLDSPSYENLVTQQAASNRILRLDCQSDFIFIAWTHYGHRDSTSDNQAWQHDSNHNNSKNNIDAGCYFSPKDCIVSVDYVANECNGLSNCQISLDAQYLHSCKSYSDYLFIIYQCVEAKNTVNICESYASLSNDQSTTTNSADVFYLQSPFYPNEYVSNLDCNCSMRSSKDSSIQIELLEFDLESSTGGNENTAASSNPAINYDLSSFSFVKLLGLESAIMSKARDSLSALKLNSRLFNMPGESSSHHHSCSRDYLSINSNLQMCGTISTFSTLPNLPPTRIDAGRSNKYQLTNFRFYSDDALTRRGFWLKISVSNLSPKDCPENFMLINNMCLRVYSQSLTWYEAHSFCTNQGYSLALIDNFELEKQLNKAIFNDAETDDSSVVHSILADSTKDNKPTATSVKKFWLGMRHLNHTNWFDSSNEIIRFRPDEEKWWPWLIVDSASYSQGSCVAKRRNSFVMEDCYKRLPFACQYKIPAHKMNKKTKVDLKCGSNLKFDEDPLINLVTHSASSSSAKSDASSTTSKKNDEATKISSTSTTTESPSTPRPEQSTLAQTDLVDNLPVKNSIVLQKPNDSTLLIGLICAISLLIASINTIFIVVICRRRKLLLKSSQSNNDTSHTSDKDSKMSSDTINSTTHHHLIIPSLHNSSNNSGHNHHQDDGTITVSGLINSSSMSYNCLSNLNPPSSSSNGLLFLNNQQNTGSIQESYNYLNQTGNSNMRRSIFMTNNFARNHQQLLAPTSSTSSNTMFLPRAGATSGLNNKQQTTAMRNNQTSANNNLDPLSHIYETISVSSANNCALNPTIMTNKYKLMKNVNSNNAYNDLEFDYKPILSNESTTVSDSGSSNQSPKSQEVFLIALNSNNSNNTKTIATAAGTNYRKSSRFNNLDQDTSQSGQQICLPISINSQHGNTLMFKAQNRGQLMINSNSPPSCASSIATTTTTAGLITDSSSSTSSTSSTCPVHHHANRYFNNATGILNSNSINNFNRSQLDLQQQHLFHQQQQHLAGPFHLICDPNELSLFSRNEAVV